MVEFKKIKKNFGFGCMRLPMQGDKIDIVEFKKMVDYFMESGFNYFDTAHPYHGGDSEIALKEGLTSRYPRDSYVLVNKLSGNMFKCAEDIPKVLDEQLEICGVDYFDIYLMHAQERKKYEFYKKNHAYETAFELKKQGKIKHVGLSFHDKASVLDKILTEYPEIEIVQIQFNYLDYYDPSIEGKECYEVCLKHNKPIVIMEPVKGGSLVNLPDEAQNILDNLNGGSNASYALRYCAGFKNVIMTISGMGNMDMMTDNIATMKECKPLSEEETEALIKVKDIIVKQSLIPCTACKYCVDGCPQNIPIPEIFSLYNDYKTFKSWNTEYLYGIQTKTGGKASSCIGCGACENSCPQHIEIINELKKAANVFDVK